MNRLQRLYPSKQRITEKILKLTVLTSARRRAAAVSHANKRTRKITNKTKEQTGNQKNQKKREKNKKRQSKNKRKKPTRNTSHKHQDTITNHITAG